MNNTPEEKMAEIQEVAKQVLKLNAQETEKVSNIISKLVKRNDSGKITPESLKKHSTVANMLIDTINSKQYDSANQLYKIATRLVNSASRI